MSDQSKPEPSLWDRWAELTRRIMQGGKHMDAATMAELKRLDAELEAQERKRRT